MILPIFSYVQTPSTLLANGEAGADAVPLPVPVPVPVLVGEPPAVQWPRAMATRSETATRCPWRLELDVAKRTRWAWAWGRERC